MREAPGPFDIDDADAVAPPTGLRPRPARLHAAGRRVEVALPGGEIGGGRRGFVRRRRHVVQEGRGLRGGLHIGRRDEVACQELRLEGIERRWRRVDLVEGCELHRLGGHRIDQCRARQHALLGRTEERTHRGAIGAQHRGERIRRLAGHRLETAGRGPHRGLGPRDDDELGFGGYAGRRIVVASGSFARLPGHWSAPQ